MADTHSGRLIVITAPLTEIIDHAGYFIQMSMASLPIWLEGIINRKYPQWRNVDYNADGSARMMPAGAIQIDSLVSARALRLCRGEKWSGRRDSNPGPPAPKAGALPGCATPRKAEVCRPPVSPAGDAAAVAASGVSIPHLPPGVIGGRSRGTSVRASGLRVERPAPAME